MDRQSENPSWLLKKQNHVMETSFGFTKEFIMKMKSNLDLQNDLVYAQSLLLGCCSFLEELKDGSDSAYTQLTVERILKQIEDWTTK